MARIRQTPRKITPTSLGEPIVIDGVEVATIWSAGPKPSTVWGMLPDGSMRVYKTPSPKNPRFVDTGTGPVWDDIKRASLAVGIAGRRLVVRYDSPSWRVLKNHELHEGTCERIATSTRESAFFLSGVQLIDWALRDPAAADRFGCPGAATLCSCLDEFLGQPTGASQAVAA